MTSERHEPNLFISYGKEGNSLMFAIVMQALDTKTFKISWEDWRPISDQQFAVYNVLIPQLLAWLIMEDMCVGEDIALQIMEDTSQYGNMGLTIVQD
jgi:hypothetical protein